MQLASSTCGPLPTSDRKCSGSATSGDDRRSSAENSDSSAPNSAVTNMKSEPGIPSTPNSTGAAAGAAVAGLLNPAAAAPFHPALINPQLQAIMQQQNLLQQQLLQQAAAGQQQSSVVCSRTL